ncbi:MAG: hypothetical protein R6T96_10070 [Longimicrobiales bacterium]
MRTTFLVGRRTPKSTEMVIVNDQGLRAPIPGPWNLRAVVRPPATPVPGKEPDSVH